MKSYEFLIENDSEHRDALKQTGFWGRQGAGCIFLALDTERLCIAHRSRKVEQPGTWGTWGGAIDSFESPEKTLEFMKYCKINPCEEVKLAIAQKIEQDKQLSGSYFS
jgi:hypothetical protein